MVMTSLDALFERAAAGEPLSADDRIAIFESRDVLALGMAADAVKRMRHGAAVTFVRVASLSIPDAASAEWPGTAGEIRLEGDLIDLDATVAAIEAVSARAAGRVPVTGFSLADVERVANGSSNAAEQILARLAGAGLSAIAAAPLDGLEAPDVMLTAAASAALPVLRLTVERSPAEARFDQLQRASDLCARAPFHAFAPLPRRTSAAMPTTGFEDVRQVALARLLVAVPRIQVDWPLYGPKLAQVGLTFGADDVDGVSPLDETGEGRRRAPLEEIRRNIVAASGEPIERDGLFRPRR
jgi:aminodeoxyfutalosine synthase